VNSPFVNYESSLINTVAF